MFQPDLTREEASRYGYARTERTVNIRDRQSATLDDLIDLDDLLPENISPNKKAVIEVLVKSWGFKSKSSKS